MTKLMLLAVGMLTTVSAATGIATWDPRMVATNVVVDTNGVKWIDGTFLPLEGRAFQDTEAYYDRLSANVTTNVNAGVRNMKHHTSGMLFRFRTNSKFLVLKWTPLNPGFHMGHMTDIGSSGFDIYRRGEEGRWQFVGSTHNATRTENPPEFMKRFDWRAGDECMINLPLYNGVKAFTLGMDHAAKIEAARPQAVNKPVVFYGTSITHGGCATRPGLGFVNMIGRDLDVPVVGLGFSGSGVMEFEMSEHIARIDASCYVLDCIANMRSDPTSVNTRSVERNYEPFIRNLRAKRPNVPIIMAEQCDVFMRGPNDKDKVMKSLYEKLIAEGWNALYYLPKGEMFTGDTEGTVDGSHPNDLGMKSLSLAFGKMIRRALGWSISNHESP